jgi:replication factor A1
MSDRIDLNQPTDVKVENLDLNSRRVNLTVKVLSKSEPRETVSRADGSTHRVADVLVGDETGCLYLTLWDENIEKVNEGDVIDLKNAYISLFRGSMRLNVGRYGSLENSESTIGEVNTENNLSEKQYEQPRRRPYFRPMYPSGPTGGRGRYRSRR